MRPARDAENAHDEAIACFDRALELDPQCAMAHWGIAYAAGPNYNRPWARPSTTRTSTDRSSARRGRRPPLQPPRAARARSSRRSSPRSLIAAPPNHPPDFAPCHDAYADAMRAIHWVHGRGLDVCALFAEALMNRTPWRLLLRGAPAPRGSLVDIGKA
jgi:hypothetical protein